MQTDQSDWVVIIGFEWVGLSPRFARSMAIVKESCKRKSVFCCGLDHLCQQQGYRLHVQDPASSSLVLVAAVVLGFKRRR